MYQVNDLVGGPESPSNPFGFWTEISVVSLRCACKRGGKEWNMTIAVRVGAGVGKRCKKFRWYVIGI